MSASVKKNLSYARMLSTSALTAVGFVALTSGPVLADYSKPTDGVVTYGQATTSHTGDVFDTNQATTRAITEYTHSLFIDGHETWNINTPGAGSVSAHIIKTFDNDPSRFLGALNSNGNVIVVDPNGVFFGANSRVNVGGILATTGNIAKDQIVNNDFGRYDVDGVDTGRVDLQGSMTIAEAGLAAFVAPVVANSGVINARVGKVAFASGEKVTLDFYGDRLVEIEAPTAVADAVLENTGTIGAEGGTIQMSASAVKDAVDNIINVDGIVTVASATMQGGKIILSGGDTGMVNVSGSLDAFRAKGRAPSMSRVRISTWPKAPPSRRTAV